MDRDSGKVLDRKQVCDRVAEVVREAIAKIEGVAEEKAAFVKKARSALESSDRELKDKKQELTELQVCLELLFPGTYQEMKQIHRSSSIILCFVKLVVKKGADAAYTR